MAEATSLWQSLRDPYNLFSTILAIAGLALTLIGFGIAIFQLRKTRGAAEAAERASEDALGRVSRLSLVVDAATLCGYASELMLLMRQQSWPAAAMRAADLRAALAKVRESDNGRSLLPKQKWQEMLTQAKDVQDILGAAAVGKSNGDEHRCLAIVADMHERLNSFAGRGRNLAQGG